MTTTAEAARPPSIGRHGRFTDMERNNLAEAESLLPGGVMGSTRLPDDIALVFSHGRGARFRDTSGNEYIDYCLGSGPLILGHAHEAVVRAITEQAARGTHFFSMLNDQAILLARRIASLVPCAARVRFVSSGSEATFNAMRLARAFTGRPRVLKFEGAYHGHHDYAALSTYPNQTVNYPVALPDSAGIPAGVQELTLIAPYNDFDATRSIVDDHPEEIAAIIVEPVQRIIPPAEGFLEGLRSLCDERGILLIFDEVVTGFRLGLGGAQAYYGVTPDLCTLGKIVGGGTPLGAIAGRAEVMDQCDPRLKGEHGYVYQNGTLNGNPLSAAVALATLDELSRPGVYDRLFAHCTTLRAAIIEVLDRHAMSAVCFGTGPMWHILFTDRPPRSHRDVMASDGAALIRFDQELIRQGLFVLPGTRRFISTEHGDTEIEDTARAVDRACRRFQG